MPAADVAPPTTFVPPVVGIDGAPAVALTPLAPPEPARAELGLLSVRPAQPEAMATSSAPANERVRRSSTSLLWLEPSRDFYVCVKEGTFKDVTLDQKRGPLLCDVSYFLGVLCERSSLPSG